MQTSIFRSLGKVTEEQIKTTKNKISFDDFPTLSLFENSWYRSELRLLESRLARLQLNRPNPQNKFLD